MSMSSVKCPHCSFLNFAAAPNCKRCRAPLAYASPQEASSAYASYGASRNNNYPPPNAYYPQGGYAPHSQGYHYPPPPPYAGMYGQGVGVWHYGSRLVMDRLAQLPDRCVKCNAYANGYRLKRRLSWHSPVYYALLFSILVYAIVAACVREKATIHIGLCEQHRKKRATTILSSVGFVLLGFVTLMAALANESAALGFAGVALLLAGIIVACLAYTVVRPMKIDARYIWLSGVDREYLLQLPPWPGMY